MVKIVRLLSGEEIIAKVTVEQTDEGTIFHLKDGCVLVPTQEGKLMFVRWVPYAKESNGIPINKKDTIFCVDPATELEDHFINVVTNNLFVPPAKRIETPSLSLTS